VDINSQVIYNCLPLKGKYHVQCMIQFEIKNGKQGTFKNCTYQLYRSEDVINNVKVERLRWAGSLQRMGKSSSG
jgi:hypothetical protein